MGGGEAPQGREALIQGHVHIALTRFLYRGLGRIPAFSSAQLFHVLVQCEIHGPFGPSPGGLRPPISPLQSYMSSIPNSNFECAHAFSCAPPSVRLTGPSGPLSHSPLGALVKFVLPCFSICALPCPSKPPACTAVHIRAPTRRCVRARASAHGRTPARILSCPALLWSLHLLLHPGDSLWFPLQNEQHLQKLKNNSRKSQFFVSCSLRFLRNFKLQGAISRSPHRAGPCHMNLVTVLGSPFKMSNICKK